MPNAKKQMRATQRDVARLAEVSQATVSRVVAGDDRVDTDTRDRILQVMKEQNYQPDVLARSLRSRRSGFIGLVVKRPSGGLNDDPFFANLASELMDFLGKTHYHLCMEMVTESTQSAVYDEMLRTRLVDGLILVESEARDQRIHRLTRDQFPFVLIGNPYALEEIAEREMPYSVDNDNINAAATATRHLFESGYRSVGFLAGPNGVTVSEDRTLGYLQAVREHGAEPRVWNSGFGLDSARDTASQIFRSADQPDALVVLDDFMAMGVVQAARASRIRIPHDLGLVSFNDSSMCNMLEGGLTSVSLNIHEIVQTACKTLLHVIEDKPIQDGRRVIVPAKLVQRGSSLRATKGAVLA